MRNRSTFVSLVTIIVAMYIGMWVFVGISPLSYASHDGRQIGKQCEATLLNSGTVSGLYKGKDANFIYLEDTTTHEVVWVALSQVASLSFAQPE
jgi:hypothetical protein